MVRHSSVLLAFIVAILLATTYWVLFFYDLSRLQSPDSTHITAQSHFEPTLSRNLSNALPINTIKKSATASQELFSTDAINFQPAVSIISSQATTTDLIDSLKYHQSEEGWMKGQNYYAYLITQFKALDLSIVITSFACNEFVCAAILDEVPNNYQSLEILDSILSRQANLPTYSKLKFTSQETQMSQRIRVIFSTAPQLNKIRWSDAGATSSNNNNSITLQSSL